MASIRNQRSMENLGLMESLSLALVFGGVPSRLTDYDLLKLVVFVVRADSRV